MKYPRLALLAVVALAFVGSAAADTVTLNLTNGFTTCPVGGCATVSITTSGNTATFQVSSLLDGYQFNTFGFNFGTGSSLSLVSATGAINTGDPSYGLSGLGNEDGFGKFEFNFNTGINGGSTGYKCSGSALDPDCTFSFTVTGSGISSFTNFETLLNGTGGSSLTWFAGHMSSSSCTGYVGGGPADATRTDLSGSCSVGVPEPASINLLGSLGMLSGIGLALRRKFRR